MNSVTDTKTSPIYKVIEKSIDEAMQLVKDNKGEFAWDDADCELQKAVLKKTQAFKQATQLPDAEKTKLAIKSFMKIGALVVNLQNSYQQVLLVQANFLNDTLDDTARSLTKELHMRGRLPRLAQRIGEELEEALSV